MHDNIGQINSKIQMNIGITGHQKLKDTTLWSWVATEIDSFLNEHRNSLVGFTSLALGADQLFANAVLKCGGKLHVIIPFEGYELKFASGTDRETYFQLLHQAASTEILTREESDEAGYFAAGKKVVWFSEVLIAVWDDKPAAGLGGTADVVTFAQQNLKKVLHINPITQRLTRINF